PVHGDGGARQIEIGYSRGSLADPETAWSNDDELRLERSHLFPARRAGRLTRATEDVLAAGELDHFRQPVPRAERRVDPFGKEHAPPLHATHRRRTTLDLLEHQRGRLTTALGCP